MEITCRKLLSQTAVSLLSHSMEGCGFRVEGDVEDSYSPSLSNSSSIEGCSVEELTMLDVDASISSSTDCFKNVSNDAVMSAETVRLGDVGAGNVPITVASESNSLVQESNCARYVFDYMPLWGHSSICGRRTEMEDALAVFPQFSKIPLRILTNQPVMIGDGFNPTSSIHLTSHFFGVYDGHGGSQVADYCRERVHLALVDEIKNLKEDIEGSSGDNCLKQLERAFTNCFQKVDDEVAGATTSDDSASKAPLEPIAPETVGSTAVVAVICSSHIIVSNCGDSRAVLCRGKQALALSVDHKPNREDERARIEAAGGKVIQWNGYRVLGVLAMSRAIGDRYLKPWVIPEPEVVCVSRMKEDECLIIASDGLWDVMTNEEVCSAARRRILHWHKNNDTTTSSAENYSANPAAQAAAVYLSRLALQKGSNDNITVIVVDLKAQRKFKARR